MNVIGQLYVMNKLLSFIDSNMKRNGHDLRTGYKTIYELLELLKNDMQQAITIPQKSAESIAPLNNQNIQEIEEKASDLVSTVATIRTLAITSPESVGPLLAAIEMGLQSVQADLYELRVT